VRVDTTTPTGVESELPLKCNKIAKEPLEAGSKKFHDRQDWLLKGSSPFFEYIIYRHRHRRAHRWKMPASLGKNGIE
jgi:hypothetical protein